MTYALIDLVVYSFIFLGVLALISKFVGLEKSGWKKQIFPALILSFLNFFKNMIFILMFNIEIPFLMTGSFLFMAFLVFHFYYKEEIKKAIIMTIIFFGVYIFIIYSLIISIIVISIIIFILRNTLE